MPQLQMRLVAFDSALASPLLAERLEELATVIPGFLPSGGSFVDASQFEPPAGAFIVAVSGEQPGEPLGCVGIRRLSAHTAEVKRLFVHRPARGQGVARALLARLEERAGELGYEGLRLDTHGDPAALALYRSSGYAPIDDYSGNEFARHWFEKRLAGAGS